MPLQVIIIHCNAVSVIMICLWLNVLPTIERITITAAINSHNLEVSDKQRDEMEKDSNTAEKTFTTTSSRLDVIREMLVYSSNNNLNITDSKMAGSSWTPLIKAAYKGHADVVALLLEHGANIHARGKKGFTALIAASQVSELID